MDAVAQDALIALFDPQLGGLFLCLTLYGFHAKILSEHKVPMKNLC